jgi:hypothetical protein
MYKQMSNIAGGQANAVQRLSDNAFVPFSIDNTDYAQFKKAVAEGAELQDAEGVTMSPDAAKNFVKELP